MKRAAIIYTGLFVTSWFVAGPALADNLAITSPNQSDFAAIAPDVTAAFDYKQLGPSDSKGVLGFDVGGYMSYAPVGRPGAWRGLTGNDPGNLTIAGVTATKGLPMGVNVGAFVARISGGNGTLYGAKLQYPILEGSVLTPAIALSATYTGASGIKDFGYRSYGGDISISKGFPLLTPFAGVGYVWSSLSPRGNTGLNGVHTSNAKGYVGLRFSLFGFLGVTGEYDRIGSNNVYDLKAGVSF